MSIRDVTVQVTPNGKRKWTWMVLNEHGFPLHHGWGYGYLRQHRKAERIAARYAKASKYHYEEKSDG